MTSVELSQEMDLNVPGSSEVRECGSHLNSLRNYEEPNGLVLSGKPIPEDILGILLSFVDCDSLLKCRLVCQWWKQIIDTDVWRLKLSGDRYRDLQSWAVKSDCPWIVYFWNCKKKPFGRNYVKNHCGQDGMDHWDILTNGGDGWRIEDPPAGADPLPKEIGYTSCFATSYHSCSKHQIIDLLSEGCPPKIMDDLQPCIEVTEWYAGRFDCGCIYEFEVTLLNANKHEITHIGDRKTIEQWRGRTWNKVTSTLSNYGPGVRYIRFYHGGTDTQFWAGYYGSKMTAACVKILPKSLPASNGEGNGAAYQCSNTDSDDDSSSSSSPLENRSCLLL